MIKLVLVEDQRMMREMLVQFIEKMMPDWNVEGEAEAAQEALALCRRIQPDVVLMDIQIPGGDDGIEIAEILQREQPALKVVALSGYCSPYNFHRISTSRIQGFVDKMAALTELRQALEAVMAGGRFYSACYEEARRAAAADPNAFFKILSDREQQVLIRFACGDSDEEIARRLGISRRTVETHRYNTLRKLGLADAAALRKYVIEQGMWHPVYNDSRCCSGPEGGGIKDDLG